MFLSSSPSPPFLSLSLFITRKAPPRLVYIVYIVSGQALKFYIAPMDKPYYNQCYFKFNGTEDKQKANSS